MVISSCLPPPLFLGVIDALMTVDVFDSGAIWRNSFSFYLPLADPTVFDMSESISKLHTVFTTTTGALFYSTFCLLLCNMTKSRATTFSRSLQDLLD